MTKQELRPDQKQEEVQPPAEPAKEAKKEPTVAEEVKEAYRKLEKTKGILHTAGDIDVGQTPHEVLAETRAYRLLHYQQMVSKTAKTPICAPRRLGLAATSRSVAEAAWNNRL